MGKRRIDLRFNYIISGKKDGKPTATKGGSVFAETHKEAREQVNAKLEDGEYIYELSINNR